MLPCRRGSAARGLLLWERYTPTTTSICKTLTSSRQTNIDDSMNERKKPRGNKAKNDKDSILADAKNLLFILHPAIQRMPKIERIEGAPVEMKRAVQNIIRHFVIAKEYQEVRQEHIREMFGEFGILLANFELCIAQGLLTDSDKLRIAVQLERIEEGVRKWRNASRSLKRQEQSQVGQQ